MSRCIVCELSEVSYIFFRAPSMNEEQLWTRNTLSVFEFGFFLGFIMVLLWEALHRNEHLFISSVK